MSYRSRAINCYRNQTQRSSKSKSQRKDMKNIEKRWWQLHEQRINDKNNGDNKMNRFQHYISLREDQIMASRRQKIEQNSNHNLFQPQQEETELKVYYETIQNIQKIIDDNQQTVEKLQRKNHLLFEHLANLRKLFNIPQLQQQNSCQIQSSTHRQNAQQVFHLSHKDETSPQQQSNQSHNQKQIKLETLSNHYPVPITKTQTNTNKNKKPSKSSLANSIKSQHYKSISRQYQIPKSYQREDWRVQQQYVKFFISGWLQKNIKQTSQNQRPIEKRVILSLYLKWKELQRIQNQHYIKQSHIQQILTNEMKSFFNCTCSLVAYMGIKFVKKQQKEKANQVSKQSLGNQKQEQKQEGDKAIEIQVSRDKIEIFQQFSEDFLLQQDDDNDQQDLYLDD